MIVARVRTGMSFNRSPSRVYHWRRLKGLPLQTNYYILYSEKINSVQTWDHITIVNSKQHRERKIVTVTEIFVASKEEQHHSIRYRN